MTTVPLPTLTDDLPAFRAALSALTPDEQANFMHGLPKREMRKLFDEGLPLTLGEMIGGEGGDGGEGLSA